MPSRRRSRQRALQILFLWDASRQPVDDAIDACYETPCSEESRARPARDPFLDTLLRAAVENIAEVDRRISQDAEHWRIERMPAVHEMMALDTPARVVIDEALELARRFSNEEPVQFVNGVLDAVHREIEESKHRMNADQG